MKIDKKQFQYAGYDNSKVRWYINLLLVPFYI